MTTCSSPHSLSHSDYATGSAASSAASSDDELLPLSPPSLKLHTPGICPHCNRTFEEPMTLQCGHSFCACCVAALLDEQSSSVGGLRRSRIRMGVSGCQYGKIERQTSTRSLTTAPSHRYRSPQCTICGERAKASPPVPNLELQHLIETMKTRLSEYENPAYRQTDKKTDYDTDDEPSFSIRDCKIAVVGSCGVGKTSLRRVQYGNDILFTDILGGGDFEMGETCMIDIVDGNNCNDDLDSADGFVLMYSTTDRDSFHAVSDIYEAIAQRRGYRVPLVLVGSKSDQFHKRRVAAFEGQMRARALRCPFLEVSSKKNDNVNEAFVELMRVVERQRLV